MLFLSSDAWYQEDLDWTTFPLPIQICLAIVSLLLVVCAIVSLVVSTWLFFKYMKYNRKKNSAGITGEDAARKLLDKNGLEHIKVGIVGSFIFGNSYSHYFKKVRIRRFTAKKASVSSLAMAAQKTGLAILDKENDPDMRHRIKMTPIFYFGPIMWLPLLLIGALIDFILFNFAGWVTLVCAGLGILIYVFYFVMALKVLVTERKAQAKALVMLQENEMATAEELEMMKDLYHLYNVEYVNDMVTAALNMIKEVLIVAGKLTSKSSSSSSSSSD